MTPSIRVLPGGQLGGHQRPVATLKTERTFKCTFQAGCRSFLHEFSSAYFNQAKKSEKESFGAFTVFGLD